MNQNHFLYPIDKRPEGHRPRLCLLKGCERLFRPRHWRTRYCSESCRDAARRWRRQRAGRQYRASANGRVKRQEQHKRYRRRQREREPSPSAGDDSPREGQRLSSGEKNFSTRMCDRPGCHEHFPVFHDHSCRRFCSPLCRRALRRVLDREARYRNRRRRRRRERIRSRPRPPHGL